MKGALRSEALAVRERCPRVLVGETYVQASRGVLVRVLDEERSAGGRTGSFLVETEFTRERWLAGEEDLLDRRLGVGSLEGARRESARRIAREALFLAGRGNGAAAAASVLRSVADRLESFEDADGREDRVASGSGDVTVEHAAVGDAQLHEFDHERGSR
jgi:hypothetical protein